MTRVGRCSKRRCAGPQLRNNCSRVRIVSLLAGGTELVCALGAGESLVGRSHECDSPEWVRRLPVLSGPTFDVTGSSVQIDALVRDKLRAGQPLYQVDRD